MFYTLNLFKKFTTYILRTMKMFNVKKKNHGCTQQNCSQQLLKRNAQMV
jgi:hypothetical protein